jgi:hypothetical protein
METPDKAATCPKCKATSTFYAGWNCPTEGSDDPAAGVEAKNCEGWKPIETAPSISPCLVTDGINVEKARWKPRNKEWVFPHAKLRLTPTHWMPLPPPPQGGKP